MKRNFKILLSFVMVISILLSTFITAFAVTKGALNSNISWSLSSDGVLSISGTGAMPDYSYDDASPFSELTGIKKIVINSGVTNIGDFLFWNCKTVKTVEVSDTVSKIGPYSFFGCSVLKAINVNENNSSYTSVDGVLFNKNKTILIRFPEGKNSDIYTVPHGVKVISEAAFSGCNNLGSVRISGTVTTLGYAAFAVAESITSVVLSNNISYISEICFLDCVNLTSVKIPDSVLYLASEAFSGCINLSEVTFNEGLITIGDSAFYNCVSLESVVLPTTVNSVGERAFSDCEKLSCIGLPESIQVLYSNSFENTAFYNNPENWNNDVLYSGKYLLSAKKTLTGDYIINEGTKHIANKAFYGCEGITSVDIPYGVERIGSSAFRSCTALEYITMPDSLISVSDCAFYRCSSLKSISIPHNVTRIEPNTFSGCKELTVVSFGNNISEISNHAFYGCESLVNITIPDGVQSLGDFAFAHCYNLSSIVIPKSVTTIRDMAFYTDNALSYVFYGGSISDMQKVYVGSGNVNFTSANIHYNALKHNFIATDFVEATCTDSGYIYSKCIECGYSYFEYIPQKGHDFSNRWIVDTEPTQYASGEKSHHCINCDVRSDITTLTYNPIVDEAFYVQNNGFICNGEITYVVKVKGGIGVSGSIFAAVFDPQILEPVEEKSGAFTKLDSDGNEIPNYNGFFTGGLKYGTDDVFMVANTNFQETVRNNDSEYIQFTFKLKDSEATNVAVDFYCLEFNGSKQISNNDFDVFVSSVEADVLIEDHVLSNEWVYDIVNFIKVCECSVCGEACSEAFGLTDVLTFELNSTSTAYSVVDCISDYQGVLIIPESYNGLPVTAIGSNAFSSCAKLESIRVGGAVSAIGSNAFTKNVILFCENNSQVHKYAQENQISWVADTAETKFLLDLGVVRTNALGMDLKDVIYCSDDISFNDSAKQVATSDYVYLNIGGKSHSEYRLVVSGDTNGDSVCDVLDCFDVERSSNGNDVLFGYFADAGDMNCDGVIDIADYQNIINRALA